jgi:tRNA pseudouridine55 synthase
VSKGHAGIVLLDKESGISSAKALAQVKSRLNIRKIGHAGTLDPMATGLLVCLVNSATRLAAYAGLGTKIYSGTIDLGISTDTDDIRGKVIKSSTVYPDFEQVAAAAEKYQGEIFQEPPQVSAVKVNGERAYKLARKGIRQKLKSRRVQIFSLLLAPVSVSRISFKVSCSKGTYIRALARDIGSDLGCGACLSSLRREGSAPFSVNQAKKLEYLSAGDIVDWRNLFPDVPVLEVGHLEANRLQSGDERILNRLSGNSVCRSNKTGKAIYVDRSTGKAMGLLVNEGDSWKIRMNCCNTE